LRGAGSTERAKSEDALGGAIFREHSVWKSRRMFVEGGECFLGMTLDERRVRPSHEGKLRV
jgi:hypothetical protein